jgi:hypothetical protein
MGFFKDLNTVHKQAKEIDKDFHPGQMSRDANVRMAALNQQMQQATKAMTAPPGDGVDATAQVVSVGMASGMVNMDPIIPVELLVTQPGLPPRPLSVSVIVPQIQMHRLQAGASLPVQVSQSDPTAVAVNWLA